MEELKQWAMEQFERYTTKDAFYGFMKIAIPIILIFVSSCLAYALVNNTKIATAEAKIAEHSLLIEKLHTEINRKLDILIQGR
jgi:cell division protein FtsL